MALSYDRNGHIPATISTTTTANPISGSFVCGANAKALIIMIFYAGSTQRTGGSPTFGSQNMTQAESLAGVTEASCELWYLINPSSSGSWVSIPNSNTLTSWVNIMSINAASGYTVEVDDTGINETTAANPYADIVTSASAFFAVACVATGDNSFDPTAQRGTELFNDDPAAYGSASQYFSGSATGTCRMSWTEATSDDYGAIAIAFKEILGAASVVIQDITQAESVENTALTQHYVLSSISDIDQAETVENAVLTQTYIISAIQDSELGESVENAALTAHYIITAIQDAENAETVDNATITGYEPAAEFPTREDGSRNFSSALLSDRRIDFDNIHNLKGHSLSISVWVNADTYDMSNSNYVFSLNAASEALGIYGYFDSEYPMRFHWFRRGSTDQRASGSTDLITSGCWVHLALTSSDFTSSTAIHTYMDGVEATYTTRTGGSNELDFNNEWCIGAKHGDLTSTFEGKIGEFAVWDRVISTEEIEALCDRTNPMSAMNYPTNLLFCFYPDDATDLVTEASGSIIGSVSLAVGPDLEYPEGPASLTIQDAENAETVENTALTAHYIIASIQDAENAEGVENTALTQHYIISAIQDAENAENVENTALTQHYTLSAINDINQAQTVENTALTQHQILEAFDATQSITSEDAALTQHYVLVVSDAAQAQTADNITVTVPETSWLLVFQDAEMLQEVDNLYIGPEAVDTKRYHSGEPPVHPVITTVYPTVTLVKPTITIRKRE